MYGMYKAILPSDQTDKVFGTQDATAYLPPQYHQLTSKHRVLCLKAEQRDHRR